MMPLVGCMQLFVRAKRIRRVASSAVDDVRCEAIVRDVDSTVALGAVDDARLGLLDCGGD